MACENRYAAVVDATLHRKCRRYGTNMHGIFWSVSVRCDIKQIFTAFFSIHHYSVVIIIQFVLGYSRALSVALQTVDCDLIAAMSHDDARRPTVVGLRALEKLYVRAVKLASRLNWMFCQRNQEQPANKHREVILVVPQ